MDGGAWWAAVHGVAQSRTQLKRLSSSSSSSSSNCPWAQDPTQGHLLTGSEALSAQWLHLQSMLCTDFYQKPGFDDLGHVEAIAVTWRFVAWTGSPQPGT